MYIIKEYNFAGDDYVPVYRTRKTRATERSELYDIKAQLRAVCEAESNKLYRLAWRMIRHGCSAESVLTCREEASRLHDCAYPERILGDIYWDYAFKF